MNGTLRRPISSVCVFSSSSSAIDPRYRDEAVRLGRLIAERGITLVFGGADAGLMGAVAEAAKAAGGKVIGVVPRAIADRGLGFRRADELIVTDTMRDRKRRMEELADGFAVLPGGFGTLDEVLEILTLRQLRYHDKPVAFINTRDYYGRLDTLFEHIYAERFARPEYRSFYSLCDDAQSALDYLESGTAVEVPDKWL